MRISTLTTAAAALLCLASMQAGEDSRVTVLQAADDARIAAVKAADASALAGLISEDLHYGHSSGAVDSKASFIDSLVSGRAKYVTYDLEARKFTFPAPRIAIMSGKAHVKVVTATGGMDSPVSFLAVWREEGGTWRFLAWQACRIPQKNP